MLFSWVAIQWDKNDDAKEKEYYNDAEDPLVSPSLLFVCCSALMAQSAELFSLVIEAVVPLAPLLFFFLACAHLGVFDVTESTSNILVERQSCNSSEVLFWRWGLRFKNQTIFFLFRFQQINLTGIERHFNKILLFKMDKICQYDVSSDESSYNDTVPIT